MFAQLCGTVSLVVLVGTALGPLQPCCMPCPLAGFLVTSEYLCWHNILEDPRHVRLDDVMDVRRSSKDANFEVCSLSLCVTRDVLSLVLGCLAVGLCTAH